MHHQSQHRTGQRQGSNATQGSHRSSGGGSTGSAQPMGGGQSMGSGQSMSGGQSTGGGQFQSTGQTPRPGKGQQAQSIGQGGTHFYTRNYLPEDVRTVTCQRLNQVLADTTALRTQARYAHWNVKGMQFYALHELFEELAETLAAHEDLIAERITALGGRAKSTVTESASTHRVGQISPGTTTGRGFIQELADCLATHDANLYQDIRAAEEYDDLDTADMLNEISREVSHNLWLLEAHLQGPTSGQAMGGGQQQRM